MKFEDFLKLDKRLLEESKKYSIEELFEGDQFSLNDIEKLMMDLEDKEQDALSRSKVIFKGKSLKGVLKKASNVLGIPPKEINYEILSESKKKKGFLSKKSGNEEIVIKILSYEDKLEEANEPKFMSKEDILNYNPHKENKLGVIMTISSQKGAVLKKISEKIGSEDEIIQYIYNRYGSYVDRGNILQFLNSNDQEIQLGEYIFSDGTDFEIETILEEGDAKMYIIIHPPKASGRDIGKKDIIEYLKNKGVKQDYYDLESIKILEEKQIYSEKILLVEAKPSIDGQDATIKYYTSLEMKEITDVKNFNPIVNVNKGDLLFEKLPPVVGENGMNVFGKEIKARVHLDIELKIIVGENLTLKEDREVYSSISGQFLKNSKGEYSVREVIKISGDVGPKTGHIDFNGSVEVEGNILTGYNIKVGGNLSVKKSIESSNVEVGGVLIVKHGINGHNEGQIKCTTLYSKFIQDVHAEIEGDVFLEEGSIRATILSEGKVTIKGKRANIIGGLVYARDAVIAKNIGASGGNQETVVKVGYSGIARKKLEDLEKEYVQVDKDLVSVSISLDSMDKKGPAFIEKYQDQYDSLTEKKDEYLPIVKNFEINSEKYKSMMEKSKNMECYIDVSEKTMVGTLIVCCDAELEIKRGHKACRYIVNEENPDFVFIITGKKVKLTSGSNKGRR